MTAVGYPPLSFRYVLAGGLRCAGRFVAVRGARRFNVPRVELHNLYRCHGVLVIAASWDVGGFAAVTGCWSGKTMRGDAEPTLAFVRSDFYAAILTFAPIFAELFRHNVTKPQVAC